MTGKNYFASARFIGPGPAALLAVSGITSVLMRFGTSPTGITFVTFIAAVSMTDSDRMPELET
jgi:hypothetical protein